MRWLFLIMLVLNLSYIAWELSITPVETGVETPLRKGIPGIQLLSEVENTVAGPPSQQSSAENIDVSTADETQAEQEGSARQPESVPGEVAVAGEMTAQSLTTVSKQAKTGSETDQETGEVKVKAADSSATGERERLVLEVMPKPVCYTLGPFRSRKKLQAFADEIASSTEEQQVRSRDEKEQSLFWVYLKPLKSRAEAVQTGERLKAKNIKDFYVIRSDNKRNGLSLGHFKNKNGAYRLAKKVEKLGFDVVVEPVFKTYSVYWLDYRLKSGVEAPESVLSQVENSQISRLERVCQ